MNISRQLFILLVFLPVFVRCGSYLPVKDCFKPFSMPGDYMVKKNINLVVDNIIRKIKHSPQNYAFHIAGSSHPIYGHAQCRGDISQHECLTCILNARGRAKRFCHHKTQVQIWYQHCFLRYDSENFLMRMVDGPVFGYSSNIPVIPGMHLSDFLEAMNSAVEEAAEKAKTAPNRYGTAVNNGGVVYAMAQCSADLQPIDCNDCINSLKAGIRTNCGGGADADCNMFARSCMLGYAKDHPVA